MNKIVNRILLGLVPLTVITSAVIAHNSSNSDNTEADYPIQYCGFLDLDLPDDVVIYGANTYEGKQLLPYPIDDSNNEALDTLRAKSDGDS